MRTERRFYFIEGHKDLLPLSRGPFGLTAITHGVIPLGKCRNGKIRWFNPSLRSQFLQTLQGKLAVCLGWMPFPPLSFDDAHQFPIKLLRHVLGVFSLRFSFGCSSAEANETMKSLPNYKCNRCCNCTCQQNLPPNSCSRWKDRLLGTFKELIDRILQLLKHLCVGATRKVADALHRTRMTASIDVHDVVTPQLLSKIERLGIGLRQRSSRIRSIARWSCVQSIPATLGKIVWELY